MSNVVGNLIELKECSTDQKCQGIIIVILLLLLLLLLLLIIIIIIIIVIVIKINGPAVKALSPYATSASTSSRALPPPCSV